eukprot:gene3820-1985_t
MDVSLRSSWRAADAAGLDDPLAIACAVATVPPGAEAEPPGRFCARELSWIA